MCSIRNRCRNKRRNQVNPCCFDTFDSVSCYETMEIHIYFDVYHGLNPCVIIFCWQEQSSIYMLQIKLDCITADCFKDVYFSPECVEELHIIALRKKNEDVAYNKVLGFTLARSNFVYCTAPSSKEITICRGGCS